MKCSPHCVFLFFAEAGRPSTKLWTAIAPALPHRTVRSLRECAIRMFAEGAAKGKWTSEETDQLKELVRARGPRWREISEIIGRAAGACRDKWRDMGGERAEQCARGPWTAEEVALLTRLVGEYLEAKDAGAGAGAGAGDKQYRRPILDDVNWDVIAKQHGTRSSRQCREKWYQALAPNMTEAGVWAKGDDKRLVRAMWAAGATEEWELDWSQVRGDRFLFFASCFGKPFPGGCKQQVALMWAAGSNRYATGSNYLR